MARSLETSKGFAEVSSKEEEAVCFPAQVPVVLLNKSSVTIFRVSCAHLHNVGVMLPYTGLHYMLFDQVVDSAFVMTSANPPNQPIVNDNKQALKIWADC